jgi:D-arabinose 1-dehydrogenase-like Zn-dependent alcohol dehydrogenase
MATTMKAVIVTAQTDPLSISVEERPIPTPVPGSVVVQLLAVAIPDFQRQVLTGTRGYPLQLPLTPGGNGIGRVTAIGSDATSLSEGQLVFIDIYVRARDNPDTGFLLGFHAGADAAAFKLSGGVWRYGTSAQYANLPIENVHVLDEKKLCGEMGYSIEDLLTIQSACIPYGAFNEADVKAGDTVIVAPATGTFGGAAVLTALAMGANVIACGRSQERLDDLVKAMGSPAELKTAALTGDAEKDTAALLAIAGAPGADVYIDFSPPEAGEGGKTPSYMLAAIGALRSHGTALLMGGIFGMVSIPYGLIMFKSLAIRGRFMYERAQLQKLIKLAENGRLKLGKKVGKKVLGPYGIDDIVEAMEVAEKNPGYSNIVVLKP